EPLHAILPGEIGRAGQDPLLVFEIAFRHGERRGSRSIEGRTRLEQADDLGAPVTGSLDDRVQLVLRQPSHLHEIRKRDASYRGMAHHRNHGVSMAAEHEGGHILYGNPHFFSYEVTEARRIEDAGHANYLVMRQ